MVTLRLILSIHTFDFISYSLSISIEYGYYIGLKMVAFNTGHRHTIHLKHVTEMFFCYPF